MQNTCHKYLYYDFTYNFLWTYDNFYIHIDMFYYSIFALNYVVLLNLHLHSQEICSLSALATALFVIILYALIFMFFVSFGTHFFGDKTLQLPVHLIKLIKNG